MYSWFEFLHRHRINKISQTGPYLQSVSRAGKIMIGIWTWRKYIYTIKTRLKYAYIYIYMCIYMSVCSELIEETGRPPGLIFGMWGYFWPGSDKFEFWKKFHTFDGVMT